MIAGLGDKPEGFSASQPHCRPVEPFGFIAAFGTSAMAELSGVPVAHSIFYR
jgi:hypothetical protein